MLNIIGMIFGVLISALWIFLPLKRVPEDIRLKKSSYILSILLGATLCTAVIIVLELIWDGVTHIDAANTATVGQSALAAFTRAALIEEAIKFLFVRKAIKKFKPQGRLQYMLLAGAVGMGYGLTEKLVMGSAISMLFDAAFSMHTIFQFITGWFLYAADNTGDASKQKLCRFKAFFIPFLIHGFWDFILMSSASLIGDGEMTVAAVISVVAFVLAVIAGIVGEVRAALYLKRTDPGIPAVE